MVYLHLANGVEEVEAITVVDLLRRAGIDIKTVSITGDKKIVGGQGVAILADMLFEEADYGTCEMIVLPGGSVGTEALNAHSALAEKLAEFAEQGKWLAAICAAPMILAEKKLLAGKRATIYTDMNEEITKGGGIFENAKVVRDGRIITSRSLGTAIDFAVEIISVLKNTETAERVEASLLR
jgi:4-methyl-5(b-hydroxyethyl)-thiazole monophosphate biosynthesis